MIGPFLEAPDCPVDLCLDPGCCRESGCRQVRGGAGPLPLPGGEGIKRKRLTRLMRAARKGAAVRARMEARREAAGAPPPPSAVPLPVPGRNG